MAVIDLIYVYYFIGFEVVVATLGVGYHFYSTYIKKVLRARILDDFGGTPKVIRELICKPHIRSFTWEKGKYSVDPKLFSFDSHNNPIGYWWKDDLRQIEIGIHKPTDKDESVKTFDPRILKTELEAKDMQDLTHGDRDKIYFIIIGILIIALLIVAIIGFYFYSTQTDKILQLSKQYASLISNMTKGGGVIIK